MKTKRITAIVLATVTALALAIVGIMLSGVTVAQAAPPEAAPPKAALGQRDGDEKGVLIARVEADGPAARAGLRRGDIILKLADTEVNTASDVAAFLADRKPGDPVAVAVLRGDATRAFSVTLGDQDGRAYLGVSLAADPMGPGRRLPGAPRLEIKPGLEARKIVTGPPIALGAMIVEVLTDTPAAKAGLAAGDVISAVNGVTVDLSNTLAVLIGQYKPGARVTLDVLGPNRQSRAVTVALGANPDDASKAYLGVRYTFAGPMWGRRAFPNMPRLPRPPVSTEIVVRSVMTGSPAAAAGLKADDVIVSLDGDKIGNPSAFVDAIGRRKPGDAIVLEVKRGNESLKVSVTLGENPDKKGVAYLGVSLAAKARVVTPDDNGQSGWNLPDDLFEMLPGLFDTLPQLPAEQRPPLGESL